MLRAAADRYDGRLRTNLSTWEYASWGYSGNPFGDDEAGKFYARAMAIWSTLLASQGFSYDGPAQSIAFAPVWKPEDHQSFFTAAEGWGTFSQKITGGTMEAKLAVKFGKVPLKTIALVTHATKVSASLAGKPVPASITTTDGLAVISLDVTIEAGQELVLNLN